MLPTTSAPPPRQMSIVQEQPLGAPSIGRSKACGAAVALVALAVQVGACWVSALSLRAGFRRSATPRGLLATRQRRADRMTLRRESHRPSHVLQKSRPERANVRMDLGFQVDPVASATSASILVGCVWGYINMINFSNVRQRRDSDAQILRNAKILVLAGKMDVDTYERAVADAERSAQEYAAFKAVMPRHAPVHQGVPPALPLPRQLRQPRVRASLSGHRDEPNEQDDPEELLQDFKDHLREMGIPVAVPRPRQPRQPGVRASMLRLPEHPDERDD